MDRSRNPTFTRAYAERFGSHAAEGKAGPAAQRCLIAASRLSDTTVGEDDEKRPYRAGQAGEVVSLYVERSVRRKELDRDAGSD